MYPSQPLIVVRSAGRGVPPSVRVRELSRLLGVLAALSTLSTLLAPIVRRLGHRLPPIPIA
jgi:hypothetical protein